MKFDIEVDEMIPGDTIEQSECERIIGLNRDANMYDYQFLLLQLCDHIAKQLARDGKRYTLVTEGGSIRILTHEEASQYNADRFNGAIAKMRRCNRRLLAVDTGTFTQEAKESHLKSIQKQANILTMIAKRAPKDLTPQPVKKVKITRG